MADVDKAKQELANLRVSQSTATGVSTKLGKIKSVRKNVARVLTVLNQRAMDSYRNQIKRDKLPLHKVPKQLRPKKTRALRRAMTKKEASKVTLKAKKKASNFPLRKFAVKA